MSKAALFLIDGFEEVEGITPVDILRRGGVDVQLVSLNEKTKEVISKHNVQIMAEYMLEEWNADVDMVIIPGGTIAYLKHEAFLAFLQAYRATGRRMAAICAAPAVFGQLGFLEGKHAVCYPGMEHYLKGAILKDANVVTDDVFTTSKGAGTAVPFALELLSLLEGKQVAESVKSEFLAIV